MILLGDFAVGKCGNCDVYFLVDSDMASLVDKNVWSLDGHGYVCRNKDNRVERMHTLIIEQADGKPVPHGMYVDHINKCKRDNRRCNLRIVSPMDSAKNMPLRSDNSTGVSGVSLGRNGKGYRAYITVNKKRIELGTYPTLQEAARVRYVAEEKYGYTHQQNLAAFLIEMEGKE